VKRRALLLAAVLALIAAVFFGGYWVGARSPSSTSPAYTVDVRDRVTVPHPAAAAAYTLRHGDLVTVPAVKLWCDLESQYVQPDTSFVPRRQIVHCQPAGHYYIDFLRNRLQVWKAGKTDYPVWGKP
jgi:hypothetical protein